MPEYKKLSRCGIDGCRTTLFYIENGQTFCKLGHLREGDLQTEAHDEGFGPKGARVQRLEVQKQTVYKVLKGKKGFELYIQCLQLVLRKQCWFLMKEKGFPDELETIIHDLWSLRLQCTTDATNARDKGSQYSQYSRDRDDHRRRHTSHYLHSTTCSEGDTSATESRRGRSSQRRSRSRTRRRPSARELSESRSRSRSSTGYKPLALVPHLSDSPRILDTLALCYLGLLTLRCGVLTGDLVHWANRQELPYLRAIQTSIPPNMREKLSHEYTAALEPPTILKPGKLQQKIEDLVMVFKQKFGIIFPPINREAIGIRMVEELGIPLECWPAARRIGERLKLTYVWPSDPTSRRFHSLWPESRVLATLIMAAKLAYGLDGLHRYPFTNSEPPATSLDTKAWKSFLSARQNSTFCGRVKGREATITEDEIFNLSFSEIDDYLDWYEKTWVIGHGQIEPGKQEYHHGRTNIAEQVLPMFPTSRPHHQQPPKADPPSLLELSTSLTSLSVQTPPQGIISGDDEAVAAFRPGDQYLIETSREEMPLALGMVMKAGSELVGVGMEDLKRTVRRLDGMLVGEVMKGIREERRMEREREVERVGEEQVLKREMRERARWQGRVAVMR